METAFYYMEEKNEIGIEIASLKLDSSLILAPMAGVSDLPFRMLNRKFGCELAFVEMLNVRSLSYKSKRTQEMLSTNAKDRPLGVQILGCEPKFIVKALEVLQLHRFDILDFNAACPVRKVVRRGEGAGLLRVPKELYTLLKIIIRESKVPVTVKIRTGWDRDSINAKDLALASQDAGVSGIFIHGRTKEQGYKGEVDYKEIRQVKKALRIPLIASGDILSPQLAKKMFDETGCDGLLVARGALGNPWLFKQIAEFLKSGNTLDKPSVDGIIETMIQHLDMCVDFYGEKNGVIIFRKFFAWYTKGFHKIRLLRERSCRAKNKEDMLEIIQGVLANPKIKNPRYCWESPSKI
jgi:tRNA-dihydrouridine synthase B